MPRKSAADLTVLRPRIDGRSSRLSPPDDLSPVERQQFIDVISNSAAEHFRASDLPVLCEFVRSTCLARHAAKMLARTGGPVADDGQLNPWFAILQRSQRMVSIFATRLRLTPHSRTSPKSIARQNIQPVSAYDMDDLDDD